MLSNRSVNHIDLRITLKLSGIHADRSFPKSDDIAESIVRSFSGHKVISVSDLFPHGFVYKPYIYDSMIVDGDENYRKLKKIKAAKYISLALLKNYRDGSELFRKLNTNAAGIPFEHGYKYIVSGLDQVDEAVYFNSGKKNPYETVMVPNGQYDIYLCTAGEACESYLKGKTFSINGNRFDVAETVNISRPIAAGMRFVLQGDLPAEAVRNIAAFEKAVFRCKYDPVRKRQYINAGSVLSMEDYPSIYQSETTAILPYALVF